MVYSVIWISRVGEVFSRSRYVVRKLLLGYGNTGFEWDNVVIVTIKTRFLRKWFLAKIRVLAFLEVVLIWIGSRIIRDGFKKPIQKCTLVWGTAVLICIFGFASYFLAYH